MFHQFLATLLAVWFFASPLAAQGANCGDREAIVRQLADKYGETRQNMGLNANNAIVEIFASQATGTWTILATLPSGQSCLVAAGQNWQVVDAEIIPDDNPA